ncbi:uncharacterized protein RHO17_004983 isoform 2-T7 [Thomomys bottae]
MQGIKPDENGWCWDETNRSVAAGVSVAQETTEKVADGIRQKRNLKGPQEEEGYNVYEVDCWLMVPLDACSSHTEKWTTQGDCVSGRSVNGTTVVWPVVRGMVSAVESASAEMLSRPWHTWQLGANGGKEQRCQEASSSSSRSDGKSEVIKGLRGKRKGQEF